jgi:Abortive infection C-terminus
VQRSSKLIQANQDSFPDCAYYLPLFSKARRNVSKHPDICIETCKSLLEGISKTIILGLDAAAISSELDKLKVEPLVKSAAKLLKANDDVIEVDFVNRVSGLAHSLGALRNARGDISHGKAVPKAKESSADFARLCLQMTDAMTYYMLQSFFAVNEPVAAIDDEDEQPELLPGGIPKIAYDDNPDFNDELDGQYPLDGKLLYSDALYRLYYEDYIIELEAFLDTLNDAENGDTGGDDGNAE